MNRIISASLSPNAQVDDVWIALKMFLKPRTWIRGASVREAEQWFEKRYSGYKAFSFNSGRSAEMELLKAFGIGEGDEVLVQAFTCVAVPNSVRWAGAKPIYVDIDEFLNIDIKDAEKKLTRNTRAIIVQHTFGVPADMDAICAFVKDHKLLLIEDCAHSLGALYKGEMVGSFGDAAFFSFGRDKVISSIFGGMAIIRANRKSQTVNLKKQHDELKYPSYFWILQQLLHPIAFSIILPLYTIGIGKLLLYFLQKIRLLSYPVYTVEKKGLQPDDFPARYPNALAQLLCNQLKKLDALNAHRITIAQEYQKHHHSTSFREGSIFLRYPVLVFDPKSIVAKAKLSGILLGNWYHNTVDPTGVDFHNIGYTLRSCPRAEEVASHIINLPTNISVKEANIVMSILP
jgi:perosamine synthetase